MLEKYELVKEDLNKLQNILNEAKQDYSEDRADKEDIQKNTNTIQRKIEKIRASYFPR